MRVDLATVKVLANPVRQAILRKLSEGGEETSTTLAKELGVTTGGTSYNLRVLAEHGLIEEVPGPRRGRERRWRSAVRSVRFAPYSEQSAEMRTALDVLNQRWFEDALNSYSRFHSARDRLGEWGDALRNSRGSIRVTTPELTEFSEKYLDLLSQYQRPEHEVPDGARTVLTYFVAFPEIPDGPSTRG